MMKILCGVMVALVSVPRLALACGGLFCGNVPVDQNAERILFEVHGDGTVTASVEISFTGNAPDFSWVVPVPSTPTLDADMPQSTLRALAQGTAPTFIGPPTTCDEGFCLFCEDALSKRGGVNLASEDSVHVEDLPVVGPYDPQVVSSDNAQLLIDWLVTNGYTITDAMHPFIEDYVAAGLKFLAMKLTPDAQVSDITPLRMTYEADHPMIPLRLTAVAAEPEMAIIAMILGDQRYEATNYANLVVDTKDVQMDAFNGRNNYPYLVSKLIDDAGGQAFVTEMAQVTARVSPSFPFAADGQEALEYAEALLQRYPFITRLYSRISAWEMADDPHFATSAAGIVDGVHDLSNREEVNICADRDIDHVPCGDTYCGQGAACATTDEGIDGCVCARGYVARAIADPTGFFQRDVTCQPATFNLLQDVTDEVSVCLGVECGSGQCVNAGGFPACQCDAGFAAIAIGSLPIDLTCSRVKRTFGPEQIAAWRLAGDGGCGCNQGPALNLLLGVFALWGLRRSRVGL